MATERDLTRLEWWILDCIESGLGGPPRVLDDIPELAQTLRGELESPELSLDEKETIAYERLNGDAADGPFDRLLTARIDRAIAVAWQAAGRALELDKTAEPPRVLVFRTHRTDEQALLDTLRVRLAGPLTPAAPGLAPPAAFLLTDAKSAEVLERLGTASVFAEEPPVRFHRSETAAVAAGESLVRIVVMTEALAELEAAVRAGGGVTPVATSPAEEADDTATASAVEALASAGGLVTEAGHPHLLGWELQREPDGTVAAWRDLPPGESLADLLEREGRLETQRATTLLQQILAGLAGGHRLATDPQLLHLALEPAAVHLAATPDAEPAETVKLLDFGLARPAEGNPAYASPEQCDHIFDVEPKAELDPRSDLYSVGVLGFHMLTGELPFHPPLEPRMWRNLHGRVQPRSVRAVLASVPRHLVRFLERCLEKDPTRRFADAAAALTALQHRPAPRRRELGIGAAVLAVALIVIALVATWGSSPREPIALARARMPGAEGPLDFGPLHRREVLVPQGEALAHEAQLRVVDAQSAAPLEGWSARWSSESEIELVAPAGTSVAWRGRWEGRLWIESSADPELRTADLDVRYLGPESWQLGAEIPGLDGRALDPEGAELLVRLSGPAHREVSEVTVELVDGPALELADRIEDRDRSLLRFALAGIEPPADGLQLRIRAVDQASRAIERLHPTAGPLALITTPLTLESAVAGGRLGERTLLHPDSEEAVSLQLNRPARLDWRLLDDGGRILDEGVLEGVEECEIPVSVIAEASAGEAYRGRLEVVADDTDLVQHATDGGRGHATVNIPFELSRERVGITTRLITGADAAGVALQEGSIVATSRAAPVLRLTREGNLPALVVVEWIAQSEAQDPEALQTWSAMLGADDAEVSVPLTLGSEDAWRLEVRTFRLDPDGDAPATVPEQTLAARVIRDGTAPVVRLEGPPTAARITQAEPTLPRLRLEVEDAAIEIDGELAPVQLSWTLVRKDEAGARPLPVAGLPEHGTPGLPIELDLPLAAIDEDGRYRLEVSARDVAGNDATAAHVEWEVARQGPAILVESPQPGAIWSGDPDRGWSVRVRITDPHGIAATAGSIVKDESGEALTLAFERSATGDDPDLWEGTCRFPYEWSRAPVTLRLAARDGLGNRRRHETTHLLAAIAPTLPDRILAEGPDGAGAMRRIRGNRTERFVFGGDTDKREKEAFLRARIPSPYGSVVAAPVSWRVWYEAGEIEDFYLDEYEVTVAQFLQFVEAEDGYLERRHWPGGRVPVEIVLPDRHVLLRALLRREDGGQPVTSVYWSEAAAYAAWIGKRLPSLVEWEFAVRGGTHYHTWAGETESPPKFPPSTFDVNFTPRPGSGTGTWAAGRGRDRTADGVWNLSGNVAEWTSTPWRFGREGAVPDGGLIESDATHARRFKGAMLEPSRSIGWQRSLRFWVAGGDYQSSRFDFLTREPRARHRLHPRVGFRCALDASRVRARMQLAAGEVATE